MTDISRSERGFIASDHHGRLGEVRTRLRPDGRCQALLDPDGDPTSVADLLSAVIADADGEVIIDMADDDAFMSTVLASGFVERRRENVYEVTCDVAVNALADHRVSPEWTIETADRVDLDRLRELDDELRQDVPGISGWRWSREAFLTEMQPPSYDPRLYRVLVDVSGDYHGICRIWRNPQRSRIGFVGVTRQQRRGGLATALLADTLREARRIGLSALVLEADTTNVSNRLADKIGAHRIGGTVELIHRGGSTRG